MTLGAFVDAGLDANLLKDQLAQLHLHGYKLSTEKVKRAGISGTKVHVVIPSGHDHTHMPHDSHHHHHHSHLKFSDIQFMIEKSPLHDEIKNYSIKIFKRLATVEAKVHNTTIEKVHFHEVGAIDSIVDIVGSAIAIKHMGIEKIYFSPVPTGCGYTICEHGTFPVPTPATAELLKNHLLKSVPVEKELTTHDNPNIPNLLRIFIGETTPSTESDEVWIVETNIDNMPGEMLGYAMDKLFQAGAVDVYFTSIQMKKERPGTMISAIVPELNLLPVESVFFNQTTTFGIRKHKVARKTLTREFKEFDSPLGKIQMKIGTLNGDIKSISPEYEDCKKIAEEKGIPLKQVYNTISQAFGKL